MLEFKLPGQKEVTPEAAASAAPVDAAAPAAETSVTPPVESAVSAQEAPGMPPLETAVAAAEPPKPPAGLVETPQVQPAAETSLPPMHSMDAREDEAEMQKQAAQQFPSLGHTGEAAADAAPDFVQPAAFTPPLENEVGVGAGLPTAEEDSNKAAEIPEPTAEEPDALAKIRDEADRVMPGLGNPGKMASEEEKPAAEEGESVDTGIEDYVQPAPESDADESEADEKPELSSLTSTEDKPESLYSDIEQEFAEMTESNAVVARFTELLFEEHPPRLTKLRAVAEAASKKAVELHDHMAAYHFQMTLQNYELLASNEELMKLLNEANMKQQ